jgi:RimJ/RimL family protein N-acetyltransferase
MLSPVNGFDQEEAIRRTKWSNDLYTPIYVGGGYRVTTLSSTKGSSAANGIEWHSFAIVVKDTDEIIGTISLNGISNINRCANVTIMIGEKAYWSKGYGAEAIMLLLDFGFNNLNLMNIGLGVYEFNVRGYKCYVKCGFKEYSRRRKCAIVGQKRYDFIWLDMHVEDYYKMIEAKNGARLSGGEAG